MADITAIASKQRQLIADMDTLDQIKTLKSLITNPPQNSRVVQFSPELSAWILENVNKNNRALKPASIRKYADHMRSGNWKLSGQTILFGSDGRPDRDWETET